MKKIFVNATALTSGGGLITLRQFFFFFSTETNFIYYIFCSDFSLEKEYKKENVIYIYPKYKKTFNRLYWDFIGLNKWSKNNNILPDLIISLQNTTIRFDNAKIPQISYVMQAIPFINKNWNPFNKKERVLWFYKNIYPFFMSLHLGPKHYVVTQAKWLQQEFSEKFNFPINKISPIRPIIQINTCNEKIIFLEHTYNVFCPSSAFVYKNNKELLDALVYLKLNSKDISHIKIHITINEEDDLSLITAIRNNNLNNNFIFLGRISYKNMLKYYNSCQLVVFPSYLETFGLPLLEAASFGKPLLVANEKYSHEVVSNYKGAKLLNIHSPKRWGDAIWGEYQNPTKYDKYRADFEDSWNDFFMLIKDILKKEI